MGRSFVAELMKLTRRPAIWILIGIWFVLSILFGYIIPYIIYNNPPKEMSFTDRLTLLATMVPSGWLGASLGGFPLFGGAFLVITGALVTGSEYGWNTVATILLQRPGRLQVLLGKLLALGVFVIIFEIVVLGPNALASYLVARRLDATIAWPSATDILRGFGAGLLILAVWAVAGAFLGILFQGTSLSIGLGLVYLFVIASLISGFTGQLEILKTIDRYLPRANAGGLAGSFTGATGSPGISHLVSAAHGSIVLAIYGFAFLILSAYIFRTRDVA